MPSNNPAVGSDNYPARPVNAAGIQKHLRAAGYNLPVTGELDDRTRSAMEDYQSGAKKRNPRRWNFMNTPLKPGRQGGQVSTVPGPRTAANPSGQYAVKPTRKKGRNKPRQATATSASTGGASVAGPVYTDPGPAMDYAGLATNMGVDPALFRGLNPRVGNLIPLSLARRGAQTMGPADINRLVATLVGDQYQRQQTLMERERERMLGQNAHNLTQIRGWYDQVLGAQGKAMERDAAFGREAVQSMTDATADIVGALGGEANEGSYVVGAAGQENIGNLGAIATIQNEYNSDMAPLLAAEGAGALAREQAAGSARNRDLAMRLSELQSNRGTAEAELRFNLWQANNEILQQRLQNELAIRQSNTGLRQQQFNNRVGLRQMLMAAQTDAQGNVADIASVAQRDADSRRDAALAAQKEAFSQQMQIAEEAGRTYRAQLSAAGRKKEGTYAQASNDTRESAWNDIVDVIEGKKLTPQQARQVAMRVVQGYGWSPQNGAVQALIESALGEAGY